MLWTLAAQPAASQNQLFNSGFDRDLSGWGGADFTVWSPDDAGGLQSSGSARMNAASHQGNNMVQCANVSANGQYSGGFQYRVVSEQASDGMVFLEAVYWDQPGCGGIGVANALLINESPQEVNVWKSIRDDFLTPAGAASVSFLPAIENVNGNTPYAVEVDNVFLQSKVSSVFLNDRFKIDVTWDSGTASGTGFGQPLTTRSASFWFFDNQNVELVVKILDGCSVNRRFWIFAGGLTNVGVALTVTDTETGKIRAYRNSLGTAFQPVQDTDAFDICP